MPLSKRVETFGIAIDDLEQHGRKGFIEIFGLPEDPRGPFY